MPPSLSGLHLVLSSLPQKLSILSLLPEDVLHVFNQVLHQFLPVTVQGHCCGDLDADAATDDDEELVAEVAEAEDHLTLLELFEGQGFVAVKLGFSIAFFFEGGEELVGGEEALQELQVFFTSFFSLLRQDVLYHLGCSVQ